MTNLKRWRKRKSGLLVPDPLWLIRVYMPRVRGGAEIPYSHYWSEETESFTGDVEHVTTFLTKKRAEAVLFWITAKYAKEIMGQDIKIELVKKMPGEAFAKERVPDPKVREQLL